MLKHTSRTMKRSSKWKEWLLGEDLTNRVVSVCRSSVAACVVMSTGGVGQGRVR